MAPIAGYRHILQETLKTTDNRWEYMLADLPSESICDREGYIKSCSLNADATSQNITLTFAKIPSNRAISDRPPHHFVHVTCSDFRLRTEDGKPATFRESSDYIARFLKAGIAINGFHYNFYGHSNSQLKSKSCFMMRGSRTEVDQTVERFGDFSKLRSVAKKAKRIGLLFSTSHAVVDVPPDRCRDIADIERDDYIFTDGCGSISVPLARLVTQKKPILFRNQRYHPSVFQIRYRGYKGVVLLEPSLATGTSLELRKSMRKFTGGHDHSFAVVGYSKPYTFGYLNDETILLLNALGVDDTVLERKQREYLDFLQGASTSPQLAFRFLSFLEDLDLAERVLLEGLESVRGQLKRLIAQERAKMLNKRGERKCRILIPKSRLLFGVCDPYGVLREGECFVNPTHDDDGVPHALTGAYVLVARNPCLHPGDLQKLRAVAAPNLRHLTDCIVFATKGRRPAADMMSGGDLDGDTFFVTWDHEIIPREVSQPAEYPGAKEPIQFKPITSDERIDYFARSSSMQLGQIKNLFLRWARIKGPLSSECQELNRLFSQCVDANRIKIPERLNNVPQDQSDKRFILDRLHESAESYPQKLSQEDLSDGPSDEALLLEVLSNPKGLSQFEVAQLALRWCHNNRASFEDFWPFIDPTQLTTGEREWFLSLLPPRSIMPELVHNDMMHSELLLPVELKLLGLRDSLIRWRCVFSSLDDRLANLLEVVNRTFPFFTRKMLVIKIHDRLSIAIYLSKKIESSDEFPVNACGRIFAFAHDKDAMTSSRVIVPTKHNSCLYYDKSSFQLYEGKRANTFVYLTRAVNDDSQYRHQQGRGRQARAREDTIMNGLNQEWRTSVALNKFSRDIQRHVGRVQREGVAAAELFVISNTDTRSLRNLDLWLEQIDTDKVHQNFESDDDETNTAANFDSIDWSLETDFVVRVAKHLKLGAIDVSSAPDDIARVLELSWAYNNTELASKVYSRYCSILSSDSDVPPQLDTLSRLIDYLGLRPELVIYLIRLCPWQNLHSSIREYLVEAIPQLIKALVLCANRMGRLSAMHLRLLIDETDKISVEDLGDFAQMVALTVSSVEAGLDLFMEGIQPMVSRVALDSPEHSDYLLTKLSGVVIEHIEETLDSKQSSRSKQYEWRFHHSIKKGPPLLLKCDYRIDAPKTARLSIGDHVKFVDKNGPRLLEPTSSFEALVQKTDVGEITFVCLRHPPAFYQQTSWNLENYGPFPTTQTAIDAITKLMMQKTAACEIFTNLFPSRIDVSKLQSDSQSESFSLPDELNESQRRAVVESLAGPLTCIWGPPGTGKTFTLVSIIHKILATGNNQKRLLVAAPTHNAVDNIMRQYLKSVASGRTVSNTVTGIRVSTDVHKVSPDLRAYTCDAMLGKDINQSPASKRKAQKEISQARLVFSTCIGAGLGLLRDEHFDNVIIDEASQQTEPASLVPLVKGCRRAVLVGDHVQLRATVHPNSQALNFDISLFERLWTGSTSQTSGSDSIRKVMLDTQYRMHPALCAFPSRQFYEGKLQTALHCGRIKVPVSNFSWPKDGSPNVFVQVSTREDLGHKSKANLGQAKACVEIIQQLNTQPQEQPASPAVRDTVSTRPYTIAILTPYTRQAESLRGLLPNETVSSIDGFQGQEADVIVYVTVRCNAHGDLGFLRDMRRLNVAITRAKAGIIVIGDEATLTGNSRGLVSNPADTDDDQHSYVVWRDLIQTCKKVDL